MKLKRMVAVLLTFVLAFTITETHAFAATITTSVKGAELVDGTFRYSIDTALASQAYGIRVTFTAADPGNGFGGALMCNSDNNSWNSTSWSNEMAAVTGNTNEYTITRVENSPVFGTGALTFANIDIQSYWGSEINISRIEILNNSGNVLFTSESINDSEEPSNPGASKPVIASTVIGAQIDSSGSFLFGVNSGMASEIYAIRATINVADPDSGFEGLILCNSDLNSYNPQTWGASGQNITATATENINEYTITRSSATPIYGTDSMSWSNLMITASAGSDISINKLEFLDASGGTILVSGSALDGGATPSAATIAAPFENAAAAVSNMKVGWNLGNSLDSAGSWLRGDDPFTYETGWGNPATTKALITQIKAAGFNAVRIPVTWRQHLDSQGVINEAWMNRVQTVINYVLDEDMYAIINLHHDTGAGDDAWVKAGTASYNANSAKYASIWAQVAGAFSDYGGKLLFEGYNEMLDANSSWTVPSTTDGYTALNQWAQIFVDTVRATGGKNAERNLIVNTYGGDSGEAALSHFVVPTDTAVNHLITEVHVYSPDNFTTSGDWVTNPTSTWSAAGEAVLQERFEGMNTYFVSKGIPVIIGEFGAHNKNNETDRAVYAKYFVSQAKKYNITSFWWDDGSLGSMGIINRGNYQWIQPLIKEALIEGSNASNLPETVTLEGLSVSPTAVSLRTGGTQALVVTAVYSDETTDLVTSGASYSTSNSAVAAVSESGLIRAMAAGQATINVTFEGKSVTVPITVTVKSSSSTGGNTTATVSASPSPSVEPSPTDLASPHQKQLELNQKVNLDVVRSIVQREENSSAVKFKDLSTSAWSASIIERAARMGLISGFEDGSFRPGEKVTRAEFANIVANAFGLSAANGAQFTDTQGHWAANEIAVLKEQGILSGYSDGSFHPNQQITRAEIVSVLARLTTYELAADSPFSDIKTSKAADAINAFAAAGIILGKEQGKFYPNDSASRAETVAIIVRMLDKLVK